MTPAVPIPRPGRSPHRTLRQADGAAVAALLGGLELHDEPRDPAERRLLEVVEAVATVAGLPVPRLFVLPRPEAVELFTLGDAPERAALAVSRGALDRLSPPALGRRVARAMGRTLGGALAADRTLLRSVGWLAGPWLAGRARLAARPPGPPGWAGALLGLGLLGLGAPGALAAWLRLRLAPSPLAAALRRLLSDGAPPAAGAAADAASATPGEWAARLRAQRQRARDGRAGWPWVTGVGEVERPCRDLLAALARIGELAPGDAVVALGAGLRALGLPGAAAALSGGTAPVALLDLALPSLDRCSPTVKLRILGACLATVRADGRVTLDEAEVVEAVAGALGVAPPPLAPGPTPR